MSWCGAGNVKNPKENSYQTLLFLPKKGLEDKIPNSNATN